MNLKQFVVILVGLSAITLMLLFPKWVVRNGEAQVDLGHAWVGSPPPGVGLEDFQGLDLSPEWSEQDRQHMSAYIAARFDSPEIDWAWERISCGMVLVCTGALVFSVRRRSRRRPRSKDGASLSAFD